MTKIVINTGGDGDDEVTKKTITSDDGGKLHPAQGLPGGSRVRPGSGSGEDATLQDRTKSDGLVDDFLGEATAALWETVNKANKVSLEKRSPRHGGIHWHQLIREKQVTEKDGKHSHVFLLPDGQLLFTNEDGEHEHRLSSDVATEVSAGSEHAHEVLLEDGSKLRTEFGGEHEHEALIAATTASGQHIHELVLPDNTRVRSMTGAEWWAQVLGKPPQQNELDWPMLVVPYRQDLMGSLRFNLGTSVGDVNKAREGSANAGKYRKGEEELTRTATFRRRRKGAEGKFPDLCVMCKMSPVAEQLSSDIWDDDDWVDVCKGCAEEYVPNRISVAPEGEDIDVWPAWDLLDLLKHDQGADLILKRDGEGGRAWRSEVSIAKVDDEERTVTGVVLEPDEVDAQEDTIAAPVIKKAAENFLAEFGRADGTRLGLMHKQFGDVGFELLQSFVTEKAMKIGKQSVKKGSWVMKVRVKSDALWKAVKAGRLTGFSIGGVAVVVEPASAE